MGGMHGGRRPARTIVRNSSSAAAHTPRACVAHQTPGRAGRGRHQLRVHVGPVKLPRFERARGVATHVELDVGKNADLVAGRCASRGLLTRRKSFEGNKRIDQQNQQEQVRTGSYWLPIRKGFPLATNTNRRTNKNRAPVGYQYKELSSWLPGNYSRHKRRRGEGRRRWLGETPLISACFGVRYLATVTITPEPSESGNAPCTGRRPTVTTPLYKVLYKVPGWNSRAKFCESHLDHALAVRVPGRGDQRAAVVAQRARQHLVRDAACPISTG